MFGNSEVDANVAQALCLPVSAGELIENTSLEEIPEDTPRFFLVDCRPADQYNAGHLATAFHLDCNLVCIIHGMHFLILITGIISSVNDFC